MPRWSRDSLLTAAWLALIVSAVSGPAIPLGDHVTMFVAASAVLAVGLFTYPPTWMQVRRIVAVAWPVAAFVAVMVVTAAAGDVSEETINGLGKHLTPVVLLAAAAVTLHRLTLRWWLIVSLLGVGLVEMGVAIGQAIVHEVDILTVDLVTGTFGTTKTGYISVFMTGVALLCVALALELPRRNILYLAIAAVFPLVGVIASGRAVIFLAPIAAGALLLADAFSRRPFSDPRRTLIILGAAIAFMPFLGVALELAYPGSTDRIRSPERIIEYIQEEEEGGAGIRQGAQLTKAIEHSLEEGPKTALLGAGVGTTEPGSAAGSEPVFDDEGTPRSRMEFNSVWAPRLIIESGLIGFIAWLSIVGWSVWLAERARSAVSRGGLNAAIVRAMPGLAGLALLASFYNAGPVAPPLELLFWIPLGICLRFVALADRKASHQSSSANSAYS